MRRTLPRRDFVGICGAALLSSCITKRFSPPADEKPVSASGPLERELRIFNWSDYVAPDTIANFEKEFDVRVVYDTYESNEEMVAKLVAGGSGYDIVGPSGDMVPPLIEDGLLQPIDHAVLPNWANLLPMFVGAASDPGGRYAMPYQWGTTGLGYRRDLVAAPPSSWAVYADPSVGGKLTMLDDGREVFSAMLKWRGHSGNTLDHAELLAAKRDALAVKPNLRAYVSGPVKAQLVSGDIVVAQLWSPDARMARLEEARIDFVIPAEGGMIWTDHLAIPREAPNRRAAHAFLNYILRPEVAAEIAETTGGGPTNGKAIPLMKHPVQPPGTEQLARLEFQLDVGASADLRDRLWTEVKAG